LQKVTSEKRVASYLLEEMFAGCSFFREPPINYAPYQGFFSQFCHVKVVITGKMIELDLAIKSLK